MTDFCSRQRGRVCKGDDHTNACLAREALGRRVVTWLRDPHEDDTRARWSTNFGRPLDDVELLKLYMRWETQESAGMTLDDGTNNIVLHRSIPDLGGFLIVLKVAQKVVEDGILEKAYIRRDMGDDRPIGIIAREIEGSK